MAHTDWREHFVYNRIVANLLFVYIAHIEGRDAVKRRAENRYKYTVNIQKEEFNLSSKGRQATIHVDGSKCVGCGNCRRICIEDVWRWNEEKGYMEAKYADDCIRCYQCEMVCPKQCMEIVPSPIKMYDMFERFYVEDRYAEFYKRERKDVNV